MKRKLAAILLSTLFVILLGACTQEIMESGKKYEKEQDTLKEEVHIQKKTVTESTNENIISAKEGKKHPDFVVVGQDNAYYCNLEENMRSMQNTDYEVLVCYDPVYDVTYYVNYGRDYFIYLLQDGKSELVLEIPARALYCRKGELYFIAETYDVYRFEKIVKGSVWKYNPVDGVVTSVIDKSVNDMTVYPDEICYEEIVEQRNDGEMLHGKVVELRHYFFEDKEKDGLQITPSSMERWKGQYFVEECEILEESAPLVKRMRELGITGDIFDVVGLKLSGADGKQEKVLEDFTELFEKEHWIYKDEVYFICSENRWNEAKGSYESTASILKAYNFRTEKWREVVQLNMNVNEHVNDFIIVGDIVYFSDFLRVSLSDGTQNLIEIEGEEDRKGYNKIDAFYLDGDGNLYGIYCGKIWRIEEVNDVDGWPCEVEGYPGLYVTANVYQYKLIPLGKSEE